MTRESNERMLEAKDCHECQGCGKPYHVVFGKMEAGEHYSGVAVRCPYCAALNPVLVGEAAAVSARYRCERLAS